MEETTRKVASYDTHAADFAERWFHFRLEDQVHLLPIHRQRIEDALAGEEAAFFR